MAAQTGSTDFQENKTIFVNGLSSTVAESELFKLVNEATDGKSVLTIHINRDSTRFETAIAYINMTSHDAAKTVISKLNGKIIQGKKINMSWSMKDYKTRIQNEDNVFVKNIKRDVTQQQLQELFAKYGEILSCKLSTNEKNESNGFGYVKFQDVAVVEKVLEAKNEIKEKIGEENFDICKFEKQPTVAQTNLYVGNIDKNIKEEEFVKYFETFGKIRQNEKGEKLFAYTYVEKYDKCRGFVNYESSEDAAKALTAPKDKVLGVGELVVAYYKTKKERQREWKQKASEIKTNCMNKYKDFNLYINTKQPVTTEKEVREKLEGCGTIYSLKVKYYSHEPTGVAYVCFVDADGAAKAIEKAKSLGWDCNKLITRNERITQNYHYNPVQPYLYPLNYFQYLQLFPQMFFNNTNGRYPQRQRPQPNDKKKPRPQQDQKKKTKPEQKKEEEIEKKKEEEKEVSKENVQDVDEEMKNELGDKLYDYILSLGCDEMLTGRITGVLLESIAFHELNNKLENEKEELKKIIEEVKTTLANMQ